MSDTEILIPPDGYRVIIRMGGHNPETHEPVPTVLHSGLRGSAHGHSVSAPPLGGLESTERGSALGSGADRPRADSAPGAVGRNAPCASQRSKRVKVGCICARANCVSVRRREAPGVAAWVPHTHGASLCRRRAAPVAHRPTWLLASSPVEAPVPGVLELWFEDLVARSDPGPDGHRGGCPRGRYHLLGAYGAPRGAIVRVRRRNIANAETGSCVS